MKSSSNNDHNPKVGSSNLPPATIFVCGSRGRGVFHHHLSGLASVSSGFLYVVLIQ